MANPDHDDVGKWVDDRVAGLDPGGRAPDLTVRLNDARTRRSALRLRRLRWTGAGVVAAIVFVAVPGTRAFGARCVEACVNATTRVSQLWRADEPEASTPRVVGATLGDIAPDLVGADSQGRPVHLSSLRGRVIVLNFWATWCGPCRSEIPLLNDLQARFGAQGFDVIGVSLDAGGWAAIQAFTAQTPMDYAVALENDDVAEAFGGVGVLPMTFIIDRDGLIVVKRIGPISSGAYDESIAKWLSGATGRQ